jgi:hypothetical protein
MKRTILNKLLQTPAHPNTLSARFDARPFRNDSEFGLPNRLALRRTDTQNPTNQAHSARCSILLREAA